MECKKIIGSAIKTFVPTTKWLGVRRANSDAFNSNRTQPEQRKIVINEGIKNTVLGAIGSGGEILAGLLVCKEDPETGAAFVVLGIVNLVDTFFSGMQAFSLAKQYSESD